jgi:thiol:disulfide interchange protein DsbD
VRKGCLALALVGAAFIGAAPARAKSIDDVAKFHVTVEPSTVARGQTATLKLTVEMAPGHHTYPAEAINEDEKSYATVFKFSPTPNYVFVGTLQEPSNVTFEPSPDTPGVQLREFVGKAVWERQLVVLKDAKPGKIAVKWPITQIAVCDDKGCVNGRDLQPEAELTISDAPPQDYEPKFQDDVRKATSAPAPPPSGPPRAGPPKEGVKEQPKPDNAAPAEKPAPTEATSKFISAESTAAYTQAMNAVLAQLETQKAEPTGSLAFILAGIFWGAVSLVTPCVFPMIPITVSFFLKQSDKPQHRPLTLALVYCGTIVAVLTVAAVLLLSLFRYLSTNPYMNIGLGVLFVVFALSLFGMYELELPSGLARFTSSREGKGGLVGTMFMALTFTIVSFACVAPFLGGFGGTAAGSEIGLLDRTLGGLAFAVTFASPFFVLALFPALLKKLPRSGSWLNSVKVVMGFLELAAALVFFRTSEVVLLPSSQFFTYDLVLGLWIAIAVLCGLYLLNVFRLPHDSPLEHLGVPRMLFGLLFLGLAVYLLPALFKGGAAGEKQRPGGVVYAWIDSFLLPESSGKANELPWGANLQQAIADARAKFKEKDEHSLVLIDFTGKSCKNCRLNERDVFTKPEIAELMRKYRLVQLYTDIVPADYYSPEVREQAADDPARLRGDAGANLDFQRKAFATEQLPLYVILDPVPHGDAGKVKVVGIYSEGKINNPLGFAQFLKAPLSGAKAERARAAR